jgi:hypothetical protein
MLISPQQQVSMLISPEQHMSCLRAVFLVHVWKLPEREGIEGGRASCNLEAAGMKIDCGCSSCPCVHHWRKNEEIHEGRSMARNRRRDRPPLSSPANVCISSPDTERGDSRGPIDGAPASILTKYRGFGGAE